jgi:hypothetical protein
MPYRVPEGFGGLAREGAAAEIRDRARDQDRYLDTVILKILIDSEEGGLGIERIEDGLDQQQVRTAFEQTTHGLGISDHQLLEGDVAKTEIIDIRRDRGGTALLPLRSQG